MLKHDAANRADGGPGYVDATNRARIERLISDTDPAQLTREITAIQDELELLSRRRTEDMARRAGLDMGYSGKAIERMRADTRQDNKQERRHRFALTSNDERTTVSRSLIYDKTSRPLRMRLRSNRLRMVILGYVILATAHRQDQPTAPPLRVSSSGWRSCVLL